MKPSLTANDRMLKVLQAPPDVQAHIDALLEGRQPSAPSLSGPLLMGMDEGAKYTGISRSTLWRLVKSGKIKPVEIRPGSFKIRREDLERFAGVRS